MHIDCNILTSQHVISVEMKKAIKYLLTKFSAAFYHIRLKGGSVYIGYGLNIDNKGEIICFSGCKLRPRSSFYTASSALITIGANSEIGERSELSAINEIIIGDGVLTAPNVYIADHNHEYRDVNVPIYAQGTKSNPGDKIVVGAGTWIGKNAVIVGNVTIGKNCVIGANSVVLSDIPDYCVAVGAPARVVRRFDVQSGKWVKPL